MENETPDNKIQDIFNESP